MPFFFIFFRPPPGFGDHCKYVKHIYGRECEERCSFAFFLFSSSTSLDSFLKRRVGLFFIFRRFRRTTVVARCPFGFLWEFHRSSITPVRLSVPLCVSFLRVMCHVSRVICYVACRMSHVMIACHICSSLRTNHPFISLFAFQTALRAFNTI